MTENMEKNEFFINVNYNGDCDQKTDQRPRGQGSCRR
jgi:hypothetical protein